MRFVFAYARGMLMKTLEVLVYFICYKKFIDNIVICVLAFGGVFAGL